MQVFKFGGASVKDADAIKNVVSILKGYQNEQCTIVVSAMGKTTNALENIIDCYFNNKTKEFNNSFQELKDFHKVILSDLELSESECRLPQYWQFIEDFTTDNKSKNYTFVYDQIVSIGEYISTSIVSAYLNTQGISNTFINAKELIKTDNAYTEAKIDWAKTSDNINSIIPPLAKNGFVITQGFIGASPENLTTTLGREGSDFTAAILSYALDAEKMVVWKDVPGILNADPKLFSNTEKLDELTFEEATEMTYYGAKVIHPKTIKPLQNKQIPLVVKSFINPDDKGTIIGKNKNAKALPPVIVYKENQVLLSLSVKDFSFVAEEHLSQIFSVFAKHRMRMNMMQNLAISFNVCIDNKEEKIKAIKEELKDDFVIKWNDNLQLLTIRHYTSKKYDELTAGKTILLQQKTRTTVQVLMK